LAEQMKGGNGGAEGSSPILTSATERRIAAAKSATLRVDAILCSRLQLISSRGSHCEFGLFYELQLPTPWEEGDENRIFREALEHVQLAEQLGFEHMWAVEHHFLDDHSISSSPETWLAAGAALTSRIRIGHGIACTPPPFVHPARLAERISTLDQISNGRVEFGTGESASRMELEGYGVAAETKRAAWFEAVSQVADMMTMTPYPGYQGEFFSMPARNVIPKPFQKPHPPLWVAGKPALAAQYGMGCIGFYVLSADMAKAGVEDYYEGLNHAVPIGHAVNPNIAMLARLHVNHDEDIARERATHFQFFGFSLSQYYLNGPVRPGRSEKLARVRANYAEHRQVRRDEPEVRHRYPGTGAAPPAHLGADWRRSGAVHAPRRPNAP
jgi:alkanesulfonate monooxygenase SsuD/methylene tetrahydromethanopterin reductase-like flavin-dependent oxidoreductase (luciferase family)